MQAANCDRCYRRKSKCDRLQPCTSCNKSRAQCVYTDRTKERTVRPDVVDRLERRLAQAENRNKALTAELSRLRAPEVQHRIEQQSRGHTLGQTPAAPEIRRNDVAAHVSFLSTTAAGERQYLGSTSGVLFADLVRASVDIPHSRLPSPSEREDDETPGVVDDMNIDVPRELPAKKLALKLVQAYLDHDFMCYPFLIPSDIFDILDRLYSSGTEALTSFELFVVDMLFAISTAHVSKYDWRQLPSAESHHARAMSAIGDVLRLGGLQGLQAILLLCQYRTGSSIQDNSGSMWLLVGIAARMCFEMGLHKETTYPLNGVGDDEHTARRYALQESKRMSFWSVLCMDRITSLILGRPSAIRDEDFDHACPSRDTTDRIYGGINEEHEKPFVFAHIVQYRLLCGRIVSRLHRKRDPEVTEHMIFQVRQGFCRDIEHWKANIENLRLDHHSQFSSSCYSSMDWYNLLYSNAMLILWRPATLGADISHDRISLQHIFDASKQSITIYACLHKSRKINYSWITLQSIFLAGLSYVYACSCHFRSRWRNPSEPFLKKGPSTLEVVNDTRACSNVLVAVSERWNALRNCHEVFDRLSDAILRDAIKVETAQAQGVASSLLAQPGEPINNGSIRGGPIAFAPHATTFSPLAVDTEFLHCYDDLQQLYTTQQIEDPIMELSQDWLGYINGLDFSDTSYQMPMC